MILNNYDAIVRHLHHFSDKPLHISRIDASVDRVVKVELNSTEGLVVETVHGHKIKVEGNVYNDLTQEEFYPIIKKKRGKKDAKARGGVQKKTKINGNKSKDTLRRTLP